MTKAEVDPLIEAAIDELAKHSCMDQESNEALEYCTGLIIGWLLCAAARPELPGSTSTLLEAGARQIVRDALEMERKLEADA